LNDMPSGSWLFEAADQALLGGEKGRFGATCDVEFRVDVLDVVGRGFWRDDEPPGDLLVRAPPGKEAQDLDLAGGRTVRK
jgi:hypothetical protein